MFEEKTVAMPNIKTSIHDMIDKIKESFELVNAGKLVI